MVGKTEVPKWAVRGRWREVECTLESGGGTESSGKVLQKFLRKKVSGMNSGEEEREGPARRALTYGLHSLYRDREEWVFSGAFVGAVVG